MSNNLKTIILIALSAVFTIPSIAQKRPSAPMLEIGYLIPTEQTHAFRFRAVLSKPLSPNFNLGLGFGNENYKTEKTNFINSNYNTFPVFADLRYFILKNEKSPFLFSNIGYAIKLSPNYEKGVLAAGGLGYRFDLGKSMLMISSGYNYQSLDARGSSVATIPVQVGIIF